MRVNLHRAVLAWEAKDGGSLLTLDAFKEMIEFDNKFRNEISRTDGDRKVYYEEICYHYRIDYQINHKVSSTLLMTDTFFEI